METKKINGVGAYELFLRKYPNSIYEAEARRNIEELRSNWEWKETRATDTINAYQSYLQRYPSSKYAFQAKLRLAALQEDLSKWEIAQKENTIKGYADFIKDNPDSYCFNKAKASIVDIEVSEIIKGPHGNLPAPQKFSTDERRIYSIVNVHNDTKYTLTIRYSGPDSFKINFSPGEKGSVQVLKGQYRVTVSENDSNVRNYAGETVHDGGNYESIYYIKPQLSGKRSYSPEYRTQQFAAWPNKRMIPQYLR